jgi:hypothetical protein
MFASIAAPGMIGKGLFELIVTQTEILGLGGAEKVWFRGWGVEEPMGQFFNLRQS